MPVLKSHITDIEHLSKTRTIYENEVSFAGRGLKLNKKEDVKELTDAIVKAAPTLKVLRLEGNTIAPEAAEELAKAIEKTKLERFIGNDLFTGRLKDEIPLALRSMCGAIDRSGAHLVEINMSDNAFGPIGLEALMEFFQAGCCYSLRELRLHNNGLGPDGARKLAYSLEHGWRNSGQKLALKVFVCGRNRLEYEGAKAISNSLKLIGTLEEIQMPQNGIRPNGIEFVADACAGNPNLRTINLNDNTFRSIGGEWMARALSNLKHLEYINFGDCLLKSKGSLVLTRALVQSPNIKEIILSFNEISANTGVEIAKLLAKKMTKLELLDLNGNKFGVEGSLEISKILEPIGKSLSSLSEDEGSDEEEEVESEGLADEESSEEAENSEVVVDGEVEEEYDEVDDYDEYEDEEEDGEEYEDEEEDEETYGRVDIVQPPAVGLFKPFSGTPLNAAPLAAPNKINLFSSLVANSYLKTNSIPAFDTYISSPTLVNLKALDDATLKLVSQNEKFNEKFLILFVSSLSNLYEDSTKDFILNIARNLLTAYFTNINNKNNQFADEFLTQFGILKSEDKKFHPIDMTDRFERLLQSVFKENFVPNHVKETISSFLKLRTTTDSKFKNNSQILMKCLS